MRLPWGITTWKILYNPNFNSMQLHGIKKQVGYPWELELH
jgi:hypothetical protein